ncbi:hypothetical protein FRB99_008854, partial [Tulasnella sp. 403]
MLLTGEFFREMLTSPEIGSSEDGTLDHPIKLANISAFEMDCFTTLLNTRSVTALRLQRDGCTQSQSYYSVFEPQRTFSYEEGGAILHLASLWGFTAVRRYILPSMTVVVNEMDVLDSIEEADKFEVQRWLVTAFVKLIFDPEPTFQFEQLEAVLHLATMWDFPNIREYATREIDAIIDTVDALDRIDAGNKFK